MSSHSLLFDGHELIDPDGWISGGEFWFEALTGTSWGEAQPIEVAINSLLRDGALTLTERDENREVNVLVRVKAADGGGVTAGTKALNKSTRKRTTLVWTPPDGYAEPRVFEVETSSLHSPDDFDDLAWVRNEQIFRLRLVCLPFWRSATLTSENAEGIPSVGATVNNCQSTTGWSTPVATVEQSTTTPETPAPTMLAVDSTVFIEGTGSMATSAYRMWGTATADGNLYGPGFEPAGVTGWRLCHNEATLTQAINLPTGAYVSFAVQFELPPRVIAGQSRGSAVSQPKGSTLDQVTVTSTEHGAVDVPLTSMIAESLSGGWTRYTWRVAVPTSVTSIRWRGVQYRDTAASDVRPKMRIDAIAVAETATLGRQVLKSIEVGGSARTAGSIHVAAPLDSVALGGVIAYTIPQSRVPVGFKPNLRQFATSGTTAADTTATNGSYYNSITSTYGSTNSPVFQIPAAMFAGQAHTIMARVKRAAGSTSFGVEAGMFLSGTQLGSLETVDTTWTSSGSWEFVMVGTLYLPTTPIQGATSNATIRFRFNGNGPSLDEVYAFPVDGDLTVIDCGTGTVGPGASSHLWIDAPSPDQPQGGYWRGTTPARQDALSAWSTTAVPGIHSFAPETMLAFAASTAAQGPTVSFDYYERNY